MSRVFIIRHARPSAAWGGADVDPGLDEMGRRQAVEAAGVLAGLPPDERPVAIASSPLRRCLETAAPLAEALGVAIEELAEVGEIPTPAKLAAAQRGEWLRRSLAGDWDQIEGDLDYEGWRRGVATAVMARPRYAIFSHFVAINAVVSLIAIARRVVVFRPDHVSITILDIRPAGLEMVERGREAATSVL
jgi:broad specificity phosphatase PhoE